VLTLLGVADPRVLYALRRSPTTIDANEWWRLVTPIFINRGGWLEISLNLVVLAVVGVVAEQKWSAQRWLSSISPAAWWVKWPGSHGSPSARGPRLRSVGCSARWRRGSFRGRIHALRVRAASC
jgi:hypothetical protein